MLFFIKFTHSLIFLIVSAAILMVWYAVFTGMDGVLVGISALIILAETGVYLLNGQRCPMTKLAQRYGDVRGDDFIADIFLPDWFVPLAPPICGTLAALGLIALVLRGVVS